MRQLDASEKQKFLGKAKAFSYVVAAGLGVVFLIFLLAIFHGGWIALLSVPLLLLGCIALLVVFLFARLTVWHLQRPGSQVTQSGPGRYFIDL